MAIRMGLAGEPVFRSAVRIDEFDLASDNSLCLRGLESCYLNPGRKLQLTQAARGAAPAASYGSIQ